MLRSKKIEDYFPVELEKLKKDERIPVALHLYFPANSHIIEWKHASENLSREFIENYKNRGLARLWVHKADKKLFEEYLNPSEKKEPEKVVANTAPEKTPENPKTEIAQSIAAALANPNLPEPEKKQVVMEAAQALLQGVAAPTTVEEQRQKNKELHEAAAEAIKDAFDETRAAAKVQFKEIWDLANIDPDFEHGLNVSTFAVIFAMAFGRIDQGLLADLAYAGLLHDIGLCQVPADVTSKSWKDFAGQDLADYADHVDAGLAIINFFAPEKKPGEPEEPGKLAVPARVKSVISQHHEKFDGSGYPHHLKGFQVDDISQLLSIADILDSFASGQWDGKKRTLSETFTLLEGLEKARTFPEYFNPDVFAAVVKWIRSDQAISAKDDATKIVQVQAKQLIS